MNRVKMLGWVLVVAGVAVRCSADEVELLKGTGLESFRQPTAEWVAAGSVSKKADNGKLLSFAPGEGCIVNGANGRTKNLLTRMEHGDIEAHLEFMVPEGSNSGVYFMGRYEIQVLDSWGVEKPQSSDCGGIYQGNGYAGSPPRVNASRKPGEWQSFDVIFRAPRFDGEGRKIANAMFVRVAHNGVVVQENQEVSGPTRSAVYNDEKPSGPMMFQGDHGPVAYRNVRIKPLPASPSAE